MAVDMTRASEITSNQLKALTEEVEAVEVHDVKARRDFKSRPKPRSESVEQKDINCKQCGYTHEVRKCPAYGQICRVCNKRNHYAKMCKSSQQRDKYRERYSKKMNVVEQQSDSSGEEDWLFTEMIGVEQDTCIWAIKTETGDKERWTEKLIINSRKVTFKLDAGAECNVMSEKTFRMLDVKGRLRSSNCKLVTYSGHKMAPLGKRALTCQFKVPMPRLLAELWHAYFRSRVWKRGFLLLDLIPGRR